MSEFGLGTNGNGSVEPNMINDILFGSSADTGVATETDVATERPRDEAGRFAPENTAEAQTTDAAVTDDSSPATQPQAPTEDAPVETPPPPPVVDPNAAQLQELRAQMQAQQALVVELLQTRAGTQAPVAPKEIPQAPVRPTRPTGNDIDEMTEYNEQLALWSADTAAYNTRLIQDQLTALSQGLEQTKQASEQSSQRQQLVGQLRGEHGYSATDADAFVKRLESGALMNSLDAWVAADRAIRGVTAQPPAPRPERPQPSTQPANQQPVAPIAAVGGNATPATSSDPAMDFVKRLNDRHHTPAFKI